MRVLITSAPSSNPYISMLSEALRHEGVQTAFPQSGSRFPLLKSAGRSGPFDLIHMQWLSRVLLARESRQAVTTLIKTARFHLEFATVTAGHTPVVWTVHNLTSHEKIHTEWELWNYRLLARRVRLLIVHCESAAALVAETYRVPLQKIRIVPLGDYSEWYAAQGLRPETRAHARSALGLQVDAFVLLLFGALRPNKGVTDLLNSFAEIPGDRLRLIIAGQGKERGHYDVLRQLAARDPRVALDYRFIEDSLLHRYLSACDVVVLPYKDVLTSSALNLASAQARCTIVPRLGCMQEFDDGTAISYDAFRADGLRVALRAAVALSQPGLDERGRQAQARVRAFPWSKVAEHTVRVYRECL